jgi:hypothetical protein
MSGLNTREIDGILKNNAATRRSFLGTYPACMKPKTRKHFYSFITNSEEHDKPGEHWNAWVVRGDSVTFFDSFSRDPRDEQFPNHYRKLIMNFDKVKFVCQRVQSASSTSCGLFCIHFIFVMSIGLNVQSFLDDYTKNYAKNDDIVFDIVNGI